MCGAHELGSDRLVPQVLVAVQGGPVPQHHYLRRCHLKHPHTYQLEDVSKGLEEGITLEELTVLPVASCSGLRFTAFNRLNRSSQGAIDQLYGPVYTTSTPYNRSRSLTSGSL